MSKNIVASDQLDLFVANIIDAAPKSDQRSMEFPLFSVSSRKDTDTYLYQNTKTGDSIEIVPNEKGRATIHDKDLLIYCFGQIAEAKNRGLPIGQKIHLTLYDFLVTTERDTGGKSYKAVLETLQRLKGTIVYTKQKKGGYKRDKGFSFVSEFDLITDDRTGKLQYVELIIPNIFFEAVSNNQILTYTPEYFSLRSPYYRRLYEICRKHCGNQNEWKIGFELLYNKFGVKSPLREFRRKIKIIAEKQSIPDYFIVYQAADRKNKIKEMLYVYKNKDFHMAELAKIEEK